MGERRPEAACGCRVVLNGPTATVDAVDCRYPETLNENAFFRGVANRYGEQGVVAAVQQVNERLKTHFVEGPPCPGCRASKNRRALTRRAQYVMAYDYARAHQARSPDDVPKMLCCVYCGHLIPMPAEVKEAQPER